MPDRQSTPPRPLGLPLLAYVGLGLAISTQIAAYCVLGATLGLFFAGILFATLILPPLSLVEDRLVDRLLIATAVNDGIGFVWLLAVVASPVTLVQGLMCYVILVVWCFALLGIGQIISLLIRSPIPAAALTVALALLWLSWPIWLARILPDHPNLAANLVAPHPLFAINGVLRNLGIWTEQPLAYQYLMTLGQDLPYALPQNIGPVTGLHMLLGALVFAGRTGRR